MLSISSLFSSLLVAGAVQVQAHIAAWGPGMHQCGDRANPNNNRPVQPLYQQPKFGSNGWWMHGDACINDPPPAGEILNLPAGGTFTVEMAGNRGQTTLSFDGRFTSPWPDGQQHPEGYNGGGGCITSPNLHAKDEQDVAGSAFAIAYKSDIRSVTIEDLVVFTVKAHTPYKRLATFNVPANLPACPTGGCTCAWLWLPNACGTANEYMVPYKCQVTGVKSTARPLAKAQAPVWCEGNPSACTKGAKQMVVWHMTEGNNIVVNGTQADGQLKSPGYNMKTGFADGAQNDIFV